MVYERLTWQLLPSLRRIHLKELPKCRAAVRVHMIVESVPGGKRVMTMTALRHTVFSMQHYILPEGSAVLSYHRQLLLFTEVGSKLMSLQSSLGGVRNTTSRADKLLRDNSLD